MLFHRRAVRVQAKGSVAYSSVSVASSMCSLEGRVSEFASAFREEFRARSKESNSTRAAAEASGGPEENVAHNAASVIQVGIACVPPAGSSQMTQSPCPWSIRRTTGSEHPNHALHW